MKENTEKPAVRYALQWVDGLGVVRHTFITAPGNLIPHESPATLYSITATTPNLTERLNMIERAANYDLDDVAAMLKRATAARSRALHYTINLRFNDAREHLHQLEWKVLAPWFAAQRVWGACYDWQYWIKMAELRLNGRAPF